DAKAVAAENGARGKTGIRNLGSAEETKNARSEKQPAVKDKRVAIVNDAINATSTVRQQLLPFALRQRIESGTGFVLPRLCHPFRCEQTNGPLYSRWVL